MSGAGVQTALARAREFVEAEGSELDRAYLEAAVGAGSPTALLDALAGRQAEGGAIAGEGAPLAATVHALTLLDTAELREHSMAERAVGFLCAARQPDGSWRDPSDHDDDAWLARTAEVVSLLGRSPFAPGSVLAGAEAWLRERWSVDLVQSGRYAPVLAYFRALANLPSELADEALQWCGRELERGFRTQAFDPVATARVFLRCGARALPGTSLDPSEVVVALLTEQQDDGGFPGAGPRERVEATLDAAVALARLSA